MEERSGSRSSSKESKMYRFEEYKQGGRYTVVQESTVSSTDKEANDPKLQQYESSLHKFKGMESIRGTIGYPGNGRIRWIRWTDRRGSDE